MLRGALRAGAKDEVIRAFPKGCFGCVIFSMVNAGYRARQERLSATFLSELTGGWFTPELYQSILSKMRELFRKIKQTF
jgi:hypothetical protein